MQLEGKRAIVYGAGGSMGGAVARAFASEGARIFLAGRTRATLETVAGQIAVAGGTAEVATLDARDQAAVEAHADAVVEAAGGLDISFNAISVEEVQDITLVEMSLTDFMAPVVAAAETHFITATAAAKRMIPRRSGVIVMLSSSAAHESRHRMGGFNLACSGIEALTRSLAGEVGRHGIRVVALRPNFTPETAPQVTHSNLAPLIENTLTGRLPTLDEVAASAVFAASDGAGAITGTVINLTCGAIVD